MHLVSRSQAVAKETQVADQCYIQARFAAGMAGMIQHTEHSCHGQQTLLTALSPTHNRHQPDTAIPCTV